MKKVVKNMERLQKVIAESGITSRRKAEELIKNGKVKVNGVVVTELGTKVSPKDEIEVNNEILEKEEKEYYLLNKPRGVITSTSDEKNRKTVVDLIPTTKRIFPVGRLDYDTTGVILLTNDGEFANIMTHPTYKMDKVYLAKIGGIMRADAIKKLKTGVEVDKKLVIATRIKIKKVNEETNTSMVEIIIQDGKNHQVKKMFEAVGYKVEKLTRERIGIFTTEHLKSGEYRKLTPKEIQIIYSYKKAK